MQVESVRDGGLGRDGTNFRVIADLSGGLLNTPIGGFVAKVIQGDVRRSVGNLAALG